MKDVFLRSTFRFYSWSPRRARAFSLYDTLVTLAVVSTVTTFGVPSFQQLTSSQRLSSEVNSLIAALHLARSEAIKRGEIAVLCPSTDRRVCRNGGDNDTVWEGGYLLYVDRNANREYDADDTAIRIFEPSGNLRIRSSVGRDHVSYRPNGLASGTNISFIFCDARGSGAARSVIVSNSGRVRISTRLADGGAIVCDSSS